MGGGAVEMPTKLDLQRWGTHNPRTAPAAVRCDEAPVQGLRRGRSDGTPGEVPRP